MAHLHLSWADIDSDCEILAERIRRSGWAPDLILGVARGGMIPAVILADRLDIHPVSLVQTKLYVRAHEQGEFQLLEWPARSLAGHRVLVVDDVSDTGHTLQRIEALLRKEGVEYRVACLHSKPHTERVPDFFARSTDQWIHYPWNVRENQKP